MADASREATPINFSLSAVVADSALLVPKRIVCE